MKVNITLVKHASMFQIKFLAKQLKLGSNVLLLHRAAVTLFTAIYCYENLNNSERGWEFPQLNFQIGLFTFTHFKYFCFLKILCPYFLI